MVHMSYVPVLRQSPKSCRDVSRRHPIAIAAQGNTDVARDTEEEGSPPWDRARRNFAKRLRRNPGEDERGAELIEFAVVVVLLITLLYGIITYGVILAAQATVTQAAADAARSGITQGTGNVNNCNGSAATVSAAGCAAVQQANTDLGWMDKGTCYETVERHGRGGSHHEPHCLRRHHDPVPVGQLQQLPEGHDHLQLQLGPAVPRAARAGRHHTVDDFVDKHPAALDPNGWVDVRSEEDQEPAASRTKSERGATSVLTAISMVLLMWAGAAGVDVGFTVYASRQAQAMADTAAIDLARYISYIDTLSH